jgi:subtilisin family serine protease
MFPLLTFSILLASAVSAPATSAQSTATTGFSMVQTTRTGPDGKPEVQSHPIAANTAMTMQVVGNDGRIVETTRSAQRRLLIELAAAPLYDRLSPGFAEEISLQQDQLARSLEMLDERLQPDHPTQITREYSTLFSGVAATADSEMVAEIRLLPNVIAVHDDFEVHAYLTESVPLIGATAVAATYGVTGAGVKVAVIDTGVDYTHPDLGGCLGVACKVVGGYDFVNHDNDPQDDYGHGTHVAGIIAANGTLKGVAPGATLLAYKVLDQYGSGFTSDIIAALERALLDGAKVANLSLGGPGSADDVTSQALDNATAAGLLSVVAAGNSGPSYLTVGSPGVARTALTVGAADKSWQMAYFSSRGYVEDGGVYIMKPEVIAPGVSIRSTVPATGYLGDPSRYASLNGTSMATPHVAGGAALLLQWNPAQTPADLKSRIVGSARSLNENPFTQGTGALDLVAAFGLRTLATVSHLSFGVMNSTDGVVVRDQPLTFRNPGATTVSLTLSSAATLPAGATLEIIPSTATLAAGQSTTVTVRLHVDTAVTPDPPEPMSWNSSIAITGGGATTHVPLYFFKGSVLDLSFDSAPWFVYLISPAGEVRSFYNVGTTLSVLLQSGLRDVFVGFVDPLAVVAREQQNVQGHLSLNITRSEATRRVRVRALDDRQLPLNDWDFKTTLFVATPDPSSSAGTLASFLIGGANEYKVSPLSSRLFVGVTGGGPDPSASRYFTSNWSGNGLSSDVLLPTTTAPFRELAEAAVQTPGTTGAQLHTFVGFSVRTPWGAYASTFSFSEPFSNSRTLYLQSNSPTGLPFLPVQSSYFAEYNGGENQVHFVTGSNLHHKGGAEIEAGLTPWFTLFGPHDPDALLGASTVRWNIDTAPYSLPLTFWVSPTSISAYSEFLSPRWQSNTLARTEQVGGAIPTFDLYRHGTFVGTYPLESLSSGFPTTTGAHEIRSSSAYAINGVPGSAKVVITFDNSTLNPSPAGVSRFRIEQNGIRTATPVHPSSFTPTVRFEVIDELPTPTATLEWRLNGTTAWSPLPLTRAASNFEAPLTQQGSIDLRVTTLDASGNKFQEEWTPAVITAVAAPPTTPAFATATRASASSIALSWGTSTSAMGLAGYRIERRPGNQTFLTSGSGTTFVDSSLVPNSAYFYRVSAVDVYDLSSNPTPYDGATLLTFTDEPLVIGVTKIRGIHVADLRHAIDTIRQAAGLAPTWTNYNAITGIALTSDFVTLRDRLNEARTAMQLPPVQFTQPVSAGTPIRANQVQNLRDWVK